MGKFDKDRALKELSIRFCIARGDSPFLEVVVPSASDLSDSSEVLTDIDVLGLTFLVDGGFRRTIFDCKSGKMSAVNRAFWAAGLMKYTECEDSYVLLKNRAVNNHRLSALSIGVDLHDEASFLSLGETFAVGFNQDLTYLSSIDRWNTIFDVYSRHPWTEPLYLLGRNVTPLSKQPWSAFRKTIAELRQARGHIDPAKDEHLAIFLDVLAAALTLWSSLGRDIRRLYLPGMPKAEFEKLLRYYIWGGRDSYFMRQELAPKDEHGAPKALELPAWDNFVRLAGLVLAAPQELFGCIDISRSLSIKTACGKNDIHEKYLANAVEENKRARQFILGLCDYLILACGLPRDLGQRVQVTIGHIGT